MNLMAALQCDKFRKLFKQKCFENGDYKVKWEPLTADARQLHADSRDCYFQYLAIHFDYLIIPCDYMTVG